MGDNRMNKASALDVLAKGKKWEIRGGVLNWFDESPQPTEEEINAKITELQAAEPMRLLREERDRKITETDWWAGQDLTMTQDQKDYRQALRDLPSTASPSLDEQGNLTNVTWPTKPT